MVCTGAHPRLFNDSDGYLKCLNTPKRMFDSLIPTSFLSQ